MSVGVIRALAAFALVLVPGVRAEAFCRLTTQQAVASRCPEPCTTSGIPLAWETQASYTFNENFIPAMDEGTVRRIFADSFDAWTRTDCEEGPIDLTVVQQPNPTPVTDTIKDDGISLIVYRTEEQWRALHPGSSTAFALTLVAFNPNDGQLVGADMELNGGIGTFTECPADTGCAPGEEVDLANVVTHEAGHFFGLAHSDVEGSTMFCDAKGWQVDKRTLELDDIEGICSAYGSAVDEVAPRRGPGCQVSDAPTGRLTSALTLGLLGLWLCTRRRRWTR